MSIVLQGVGKRFGGFVALDDVSLEVPPGKLLALLGPSGSGKTTLLRILGGLETADAGRVLLDGADVTGMPPREREAGFVFQHYALFRHMTVFDNVAFGLRVRRRPRDDIRAKVMELLGLVGLGQLAGRYPSELSGGQRQRVALARALAIAPKLLLLDEPFAALDAKVRAELRGWLRRLHAELHVTTVFVTHDQEEAFEVADSVALLDRGRIQQIGTPDDVFERPANAFVLDFLGRVNVFHGRVHDGAARFAGVKVPAAGAGPATGYVRAHEFDLTRERPHAEAFRARVLQAAAVGAAAKLTLAADGQDAPVQVEISRDRFRELALAPGDEVFVAPRQWHVFAHDDYQI